MRLDFSYNMGVESAYIIRIKGNEKSERLALRCKESCDKIGQPSVYWDAYNGLENPIVPPEHHSEVMNLIRQTDHYLTRGELACAFSHISLWNRCVQIDQPVVILEHDAVAVAPYLDHALFNSICYLGGHEQAVQGKPCLPTPPHGSDGKNYHFLCRAHAYAIDPAVAKNMLAHVIKYGVCAPLDILLRADIFPIHQMGMYAYDHYETADKNAETTIFGRPKSGRNAFRNENLEL
jgi:hypothetical protein